MNSKRIWIVLVILIALAGAAYFFRDSLATYLGGTNNQARAQGNSPNQEQQTVAIRPAADASQVSAAGNIALASQQAAVFQVGGIVTEIAVKPGDTVKAGDLLVALDSTELERAVQRANLSLSVSRNALAQLHEPASQADIEAAQSNLAAAQESLAELQAGPSAAELEAAQAVLTAAQAAYEDLLAGPSEAELTQLSAELHKAFLTLEQAQEAYNEIAYRGDIGQTQQAMDLQTATIDYDTAKAAYDIATAPASEAELQGALQAIVEAQVQLEALHATQAELASAEAQVASAEASLAALLDGASETEVRAAELAIEQAQVDLEEAEANRERAQLRAPIDAAILTVDIQVGQQVTAGLSALTLADLTNLELPVYVAEVDISKVKLGQPVNIAIDALPDQLFSGEVSRIAPTSQSDSGVVNYQVTLQLNDLELADGVRPGMTAVATILGEGAQNAWLVPSNALVEFEGETTVRVVQNGREERVTVTTSSTQGEWTVVQSDELQAGDEVVGRVSSPLSEESQSSGQPRGFFGPPGGRPPSR
jgi:RND family efflux transporter MFP subunit